MEVPSTTPDLAPLSTLGRGAKLEVDEDESPGGRTFAHSSQYGRSWSCVCAQKVHFHDADVCFADGLPLDPARLLLDAEEVGRVAPRPDDGRIGGTLGRTAGGRGIGMCCPMDDVGASERPLHHHVLFSGGRKSQASWAHRGEALNALVSLPMERWSSAAPLFLVDRLWGRRGLTLLQRLLSVMISVIDVTQPKSQKVQLLRVGLFGSLVLWLRQHAKRFLK